MEDKHLFMDKLNLFIIGAIVGGVIMGLFVTYSYVENEMKQNKIIDAYGQYYHYTETLLDSLDGTRNLDLMDTDLATDYGEDYLHAKSVVDSLLN